MSASGSQLLREAPHPGRRSGRWRTSRLRSVPGRAPPRSGRVRGWPSASGQPHFACRGNRNPKRDKMASGKGVPNAEFRVERSQPDPVPQNRAGTGACPYIAHRGVPPKKLTVRVASPRALPSTMARRHTRDHRQGRRLALAVPPHVSFAYLPRRGFAAHNDVNGRNMSLRVAQPRCGEWEEGTPESVLGAMPTPRRHVLSRVEGLSTQSRRHGTRIVRSLGAKRGNLRSKVTNSRNVVTVVAAQPAVAHSRAPRVACSAGACRRASA